jgi:hypothetical protein
VGHARKLKPDLKVLLITGCAHAPKSKRATIEHPILKKPHRRRQLEPSVREVLDHAA